MPAPPPVPVQTALLVAVADAVPQLVATNITAVAVAAGGAASNATLVIGTGHAPGTYTPQAGASGWQGRVSWITCECCAFLAAVSRRRQCKATQRNGC